MDLRQTRAPTLDELDKWISDVLEGRISTETDDGDYDLAEDDDDDEDEDSDDAEDNDGKFVIKNSNLRKFENTAKSPFWRTGRPGEF